MDNKCQEHIEDHHHGNKDRLDWLKKVSVQDQLNNSSEESVKSMDTQVLVPDQRRPRTHSSSQQGPENDWDDNLFWSSRKSTMSIGRAAYLRFIHHALAVIPSRLRQLNRGASEFFPTMGCQA